jgi:hypothetical protein
MAHCKHVHRVELRGGPGRGYSQIYFRGGGPVGVLFNAQQLWGEGVPTLRSCQGQTIFREPPTPLKNPKILGEGHFIAFLMHNFPQLWGRGTKNKGRGQRVQKCFGVCGGYPPPPIPPMLCTYLDT